MNAQVCITKKKKKTYVKTTYTWVKNGQELCHIDGSPKKMY